MLDFERDISINKSAGTHSLLFGSAHPNLYNGIWFECLCGPIIIIKLVLTEIPNAWKKDEPPIHYQMIIP